MKKAESKYELVVAVAKRARHLTEVGHSLKDARSLKPVTVALEEIAEGKIVIKNPNKE